MTVDQSIYEETALDAILDKLKEKEKARERLLNDVANLDVEVSKIKQHYYRIYNQHQRILRIPVELTSLIFQAAAGDHDVDRGRTGSTVSHVCHAWRTIALSLPKLWSTFTYNNALSDYHRLQTYLERSINQLLNLNFILVDVGLSTDQLLKDILNLAAGQVWRWRRFILHFEPFHERADQYWQSALLGLFDQTLSAPNLEVIEVVFDTEREADVGLDPLLPWFKGKSPKLTYAAFDSWTLMAFRPLCNVTNLQIVHSWASPSRYHLDIFLNILVSTRLENLTLIGDPFNQTTTGLRPVVAPELRNFRFCNSENLAYILLKFIRAPKLELLIIKNIELVESWAIPSKFASNPFPSLRSLVLLNCTTDYSGISLLAEATKTVTDLYMFHDASTGSTDTYLLSILGESAPGPAKFWPHLRSLLCGGDYLMEECDKSAFEAFLKSVTCHSEPLRTRRMLKLPKEDAKIWQERDPDTWEQLVIGGFYEERIVFKVDDFVPWPPRNTETFQSTLSSEKAFLADYYCSLHRRGKSLFDLL